MKPEKSWMTNTGNVLLGVGSLLGASAVSLPLEKYRGWMTFSGIMLAGIGQVLANRGIRRRLPTRRTPAVKRKKIQEPPTALRQRGSNS